MKTFHSLPVLKAATFCVAFLSASLTAALSDGTNSSAVAFARIGDTDVKVEDFRAYLETLNPNDQAALVNDPALLNKTVRSLLVEKAVYKEAVARQWDKRPDVTAQLDQIRINTVSESYLKSVTQAPEGYPSDSELQAAYDSRKDTLQVPRRYQLAEIFVAASKSADSIVIQKAQDKLDSIQKELKQPGADFAAIAKSESDQKQTAEHGGEMGWFVEARMPMEVRVAVMSLARDSVSEPVRLDDGWHIVKVLDIKEPYTPSLDEIRVQLVQQLRNEQALANRKAYLTRLVQRNPVAVNELAISKALDSQSDAAGSPKTP